VLCHGSKLTNSLGRIKLNLTPLGNNNLNFRDQVMYLETATNLCASWCDIKKPLKSGNVSH